MRGTRRIMLMKMAFVVVGVMAVVCTAQNRPAPRARGFGGPQVVSPEVASDGHVTFRILAPEAEAVRLTGGDIPNLGQGAEMTKDANGVWEVTLGPLEAGAYRYNFNVDGVSVIDPRSSSVSESNMNVWSLVYVPGSDFMDTEDVPHGAVAEVTYYSKSLKRFRRMHVYTPPGYETNQKKYPIFYLLHGAFDCDDSWTTVGRAGFILDNLIAAGKARPMVVVMPAGHTGPFTFGRGLPMDEFTMDFRNDIMPYAETHYRVYTDQANRAIAGLSMGGAQTLNVSIPNPGEFGYIGVFSSGIFDVSGRRFGNDSGPTWEERHKSVLENSESKKGLKYFWFATGKDDFLVQTSQASVEMFKKYGYKPIYKETSGAHTWINWREYLNEFAPKLFQ